jgi:hypothetical protein
MKLPDEPTASAILRLRFCSQRMHARQLMARIEADRAKLQRMAKQAGPELREQYEVLLIK